MEPEAVGDTGFVGETALSALDPIIFTPLYVAAFVAVHLSFIDEPIRATYNSKRHILKKSKTGVPSSGSRNFGEGGEET